MNIGKLTKEGKIEDGALVIVYDQKTEDFEITSISSTCLLPNGDKLLILNQNNMLF
jgi:hypothetical protein